MRVAFEVRDINPLAWQSTRKGPYGFYKPQHIKDYQELIGWHASQAMGNIPPYHGNVIIEVSFYRKTKHWVDNDNLLKPVSDALNGIVYMDDHQIVDDHLYKRFCKDPGLVIVVESTNEPLEVEQWTLE